MTTPYTGNQKYRLKDWFLNRALPLWADSGYDKRNGGFFEALDFNGTPVVDAPRRVRVQARQIYVFSRAGSLGWHPDAEAIASKGFDYFLNRACPENGSRGCVHILASDGAVADEKRDLYDQAFLFLACAWRWHVAKDERALALAEQTHAFLNQDLASAHGGWIENDSIHLPRRQNPHMHLFEAFMALYDATGDEKYLLEADNIFVLFKTKFFDSNNNVLREFFADDLVPATGEAGAFIEPGHMVEWVWLLNKYSRYRAVDVSDYCQKLFRSAQKLGTASDSIFLVDSLSLNNEAGGTRRLWPQTEYLKATSVFAHQGDNEAHDLMTHLIAACFETYFDQSTAGLWCDQFDGDGNPCADNVPASILYHLLDAVLAVQPTG